MCDNLCAAHTGSATPCAALLVLSADMNQAAAWPSIGQQRNIRSILLTDVCLHGRSRGPEFVHSAAALWQITS